MSDKLKIGIIGAGMIGGVHIENIRRDGRAEVGWIATRSKATLEEKMAQYKISKGTQDYRDILQDPEVDAVVISTPPFLHLQMLQNALQAGKHILLEKPMAQNPAEVDRIVAEVEKYPELIVLECSCRHTRLQPKYKFVKDIVQSGKLGRVYHIHQNHLQRRTFLEWNPAGDWALKKEKAGGGPLVDQGVYDLAFHLGLFDDQPQLQNFQAFTQKGLKPLGENMDQQNIEQHGAALMEFDTGLTYYYERGEGLQFEKENKTRIHGTRGGLEFDFYSWGSQQVELYYRAENGKEQKEILEVQVAEEHDDNFALIKHFLDCLIEGEKVSMPVQLAAKHMRIIYQILNHK